MDFPELPELGFDPCCGCVPLQKGVKTIAIIDLVTASVSAGSLFLMLFLILAQGQDLASAAEADRAEFPAFADFMALGPGIAALVILAFMIQSVIYILLARFLLHGAMERNYEKIHLWYSITLILVAIRFLYYIIGLIMSTNIFPTLLFGLFGFFYSVYSLFVASAYKNELRRTGEASKLHDTYPTSQYHVYSL